MPIWSPTQPIPSTLGAVALYLVAFVVLTSYLRRAFGRHRWKQLHYVAYAAAIVFYVHGTWADPLLQNRPVDFVDAEKKYVEGCGLAVAAATFWRLTRRRGPEVVRPLLPGPELLREADGVDVAEHRVFGGRSDGVRKSMSNAKSRSLGI